MDNQYTKSLRDRILKDSPWRAVLIAVALLVIGQLLLVWQYRRLEEGRVANLEEKVEEQAQALQERAAQDALKEFMEARVAGSEQTGLRYVTERTAFQMQENTFEFSGVQDYTIVAKKKAGDEAFEFQVEIARDRSKQIELINLLKIGEEYYVDSVQLAG